jgi:hypothetical protein
MYEGILVEDGKQEGYHLVDSPDAPVETVETAASIISLMPPRVYHRYYRLQSMLHGIPIDTIWAFPSKMFATLVNTEIFSSSSFSNLDEHKFVSF